ncbi:LuxR C-terminal-related transcriptional regulator [Actinoplanes subglobosus]|uniref:LuxR C-terminal-related transcriptional regulator n=1 Tax=Actinoplanes subglobosus TaxID=1547892 RepID=A0ABV8J3S0_9ACTN
MTDGLRGGVTDGPSGCGPDRLPGGVTDGLRGRVTGGSRGGVTDGLRGGVTDGLRGGVTGGSRGEVTDGSRGGVTDGSRGGVTGDLPGGATEGSHRGVGSVEAGDGPRAAGSVRRERAVATLRRLTERERDVAEAVASGWSNAEISAELHMSLPTVKAYVSRLLDKLGCTNRVQIAILIHEAR